MLFRSLGISFARARNRSRLTLPLKHPHHIGDPGRERVVRLRFRARAKLIPSGAALAGNLWMWSWWQKRAQKQAVVPEIETSAYGRPLVRKV